MTLFSHMSFAEYAQDSVNKKKRNQFHLGFGFGMNKLKIGNTSRVEEGINFDLKGHESEVDDVSKVCVKWWFSENVGFEIAKFDYGEVEQDFTYNDTRNGNIGTGKATINPTGTSFAFLLGYDLPKNVRWNLSLGLMRWKQEMISRFDASPTNPNTERFNLKYDGQTIFFGAGVAWNFSGGWNLNLNTEVSKMDDDKLVTNTVSITYDLMHIFQRAP